MDKVFLLFAAPGYGDPVVICAFENKDDADDVLAMIEAAGSTRSLSIKEVRCVPSSRVPKFTPQKPVARRPESLCSDRAVVPSLEPIGVVAARVVDRAAKAMPDVAAAYAESGYIHTRDYVEAVTNKPGFDGRAKPRASEDDVSLDADVTARAENSRGVDQAIIHH
ncbi:hypothetical protein [Aestuariivirga sp.]|uniref:hypothetical protein n=1 Tax=Aestuariivirga sp. TaxID=2650926 RepID=UPI0039E5DFF8